MDMIGRLVSMLEQRICGVSLTFYFAAGGCCKHWLYVLRHQELLWLWEFNLQWRLMMEGKALLLSGFIPVSE